MTPTSKLALVVGIASLAASACSAPITNPRRAPICEPTPPPARVVRYLSAQVDDALSPSYGLVLEDEDGVPTRVLNLSAWQRESDDSPAATLADQLAVARARWDAWRIRSASSALTRTDGFERFTDTILREDAEHRICAPIAVPQAALDAGDAISIGVGLNFAAHAAEAGDDGGIFFFPKIAEPTGAYQSFERPEAVSLLDYEVEIGFVVLEDIDLGALPARDELDARLAYFHANDISNREPIILGTRASFTEAKSLRGSYPAGPWLVHGADLRPFPATCSRPLGMQLEVDERDGFRSLRQHSNTNFMLNDPHALLTKISARAREQLEAVGAPVVDAVFRESDWQFPIAKRVGDDQLILPAGSIVVTGTPEGVALQAPSAIPLSLRGIAHLRDPFSQFLVEQRENLDAEGYLKDGDVVESRVDQLGTQRWQIRKQPGPAAAGVPAPASPCQRR